MDHLQQWVEWDKAGVSRSEIARRANKSPNKITRELLGAGQCKKAGGRKPTYDRTRWRELYDHGCADLEIARQTGCNHTTVMHWRRSSGLPANNAGGRVGTIDYETVLSLYNSGHTDKAIAERLGCSSHSIWVWRKKQSLQSNSRKSA